MLCFQLYRIASTIIWTLSLGSPFRDTIKRSFSQIFGPAQHQQHPKAKQEPVKAVQRTDQPGYVAPQGAVVPVSYTHLFRIEWLSLALVTVSGLIYNIGLLATPWFEGRLAQCLADILGGSATAAAMAILVLTYVLVTLVVQAARFKMCIRDSSRTANLRNFCLFILLFINCITADVGL